jgi:hypothetical protein
VFSRNWSKPNPAGRRGLADSSSPTISAIRTAPLGRDRQPQALGPANIGSGNSSPPATSAKTHTVFAHITGRWFPAGSDAPDRQ